MSEENMKVVRRLLDEVWTAGDLSLLPELMAEAFVGHTAPQGSTLEGRDRYQQLIALYKGVFLETHFSVDDQFASGDKVATRWSARVKEDSEAAQHDSVTGKPITISGISITRLENGKIVEGWDTWDTLGLLQSSSEPNIFERLSMTV